MREGWALIVTAEHASRAVPSDCNQLGLHDAVFETHVVWDPGAKEVATMVATHFDVPLLLGEWTRLLVDLNRSPAGPEAVPNVAFGVPVPANAALDEAGRQARLERYHRPYWDRARALVTAALSRAERVLHLSVHSFTPEYAGQVRDVDLGVMMDPERPLEREVADRWLASFMADGFVSKENQPYDGRADALVTSLRGEFSIERYAGVELEINQKLRGRLVEVAHAVQRAISLP